MKEFGNHQVMHMAAQYLAAAARSCNTPAADDSHTCMLWNPDVNSLQVDIEGKDLRFGLSYRKFSLEFRKISNSLIDSMELTGTTHNEIIPWITSVLGMDILFDLPYDLPYAVTVPDFRFDRVDPGDLEGLRLKRELASDALEAFRMNLSNPSPVRTWPHHFDTAVLEDLGNGRSLGFGMAVPDRMIGNFYFYAYAFDGDKPVDVTGLQEPGKGAWISSENFKGAVMSSENADKASVMSFFYTCHKLLNERLLVT